MKKRRLLLGLGVLLAAAVAAVLLPTPRLVCLGWLRGESFYRGRPASFWSGELKSALVRATPPGGDESRLSLALPAPSVWDRCLERLGGEPHNTRVFRLFEGDPAVVPVLTELLSDGDPHVREMAETLLERPVRPNR
jgi:hypothetical protein